MNIKLDSGKEKFVQTWDRISWEEILFPDKILKQFSDKL